MQVLSTRHRKRYYRSKIRAQHRLNLRGSSPTTKARDSLHRVSALLSRPIGNEYYSSAAKHSFVFLFTWEHFTGKKQIPKTPELGTYDHLPFSKLKGVFALISAQLRLTPTPKLQTLLFESCLLCCQASKWLFPY